VSPQAGLVENNSPRGRDFLQILSQSGHLHCSGPEESHILFYKFKKCHNKVQKLEFLI
jgi:hypothetical protein